MTRKQILIDLLQQGYEVEVEFYSGLTDADKTAVGRVDEWSPKDVIAHCAYWKQFRVADILKVMEGGSVANIDDFDHENAKIFEMFRDKSWPEVMAYAEEATAVLSAQLEKMNESELEMVWHDERPIWRVIVTNGYSHPLIHISEHYQQKGDMQRAAVLTGMLGKPLAALDDSPLWAGTVHYNVACSYALMGKKDAAIAELSQALTLTPQLIEWSQQDADLESLREDPAYQALYK